jgi:hypothetical protein
VRKIFRLPSKLFKIQHASSWDVSTYVVQIVVVNSLMLLKLASGYMIILLKGMDKVFLLSNISHELKILGVCITFS